MADVLLQKITVTRELLDDGTESYDVEYYDHSRGDEIGWLDGLGLLEAAKFDLYERHNQDPEEADEQ